MKKTTILSFLFAGLVMTSCFKKDRTCECTDTVVSQTSTQPNYTYTPPAPTTTTTKYTKVKKNNVLVTTCVASERTNSYQSTYYNSTTKTNEDCVITRVTKSDCKIK